MINKLKKAPGGAKPEPEDVASLGAHGARTVSPMFFCLVFRNTKKGVLKKTQGVHPVML